MGYHEQRLAEIAKHVASLPDENARARFWEAYRKNRSKENDIADFYDYYVQHYGPVTNLEEFLEKMPRDFKSKYSVKGRDYYSDDLKGFLLSQIDSFRNASVDDISEYFLSVGDEWVPIGNKYDYNSKTYTDVALAPGIGNKAKGAISGIRNRLHVVPSSTPVIDVSPTTDSIPAVAPVDSLSGPVDSLALRQPVDSLAVDSARRNLAQPDSVYRPAVGDSIIPPGVVPVDSVQRQANIPMQYLYSVQPEQQGQAKNQQQQQAQQPATTGTQKKAKVKQQAKNQQQGQSQAKTQNQEQQQTQNQEQAETAEKKEEVKKEGSETPSSIEWDPIKAHLKTKEGQKKRDLTYEDYLIPNIYNLPLDHDIVSKALASISQYEQAQASLADNTNVQPVASNQVASTGDVKTSWTSKLPNFFRQAKQYLPTLGDAVSSIGLMSGMYNNLRNTYLEQASSLPNINPYVNYGLGTLAGLDDQRQFVNAQFDTYGNDMRSQYDSMMRQVSNNARGMNQSRAMRLSSLSDYADRSWKNELQRLSQLNNISQQRNNVMTQRDQYLAQGEQAKHQANQQDIASFYSNLNNAQNGVAQGWQNVGKHLNHYALEGARMNILNQYSPYGIQSDRYGRLYAVRPEEEQYR